MELRKIIHVDMDAFYASVEQRDDPRLRGKAIVVGYSGSRGVVAAASYEARKYGVRSAMPSAWAKRLCPHLIFVPGNMEKYRDISYQIRDIFQDYTDRIEPLSFDEAFLDVTENKPGIPLGVDVARAIKSRIRNELNLVASAGVSYNKFLAKIASDYRKPDGLCTIHPEIALDFIAKLPIESFWGVGKVTAEKMRSLGIFDGATLRAQSLSFLIRQFGKAGTIYYDFARGIDHREVETVRIRKSVGCEDTFLKDLSDTEDILAEIRRLADRLQQRIDRAGFRGMTLTLKIKYNDFSLRTRSLTHTHEITEVQEIFSLAQKLLNDRELEMPVRLLGLSVSNPVCQYDIEYPYQLELEFPEY